MKTTQPISRSETQWTIAPVLACNSEPVRPEWIRLPPGGQRCRYTGLTRSFLNSLVLPCTLNEFKPPVKSVCLRRKGSAKGVRLIHLQSLLDFIAMQSP